MPAPYIDDADVRVYLGDSLDVMRSMPAESVDAVVTDPPYGLEFMGKEWDAPWKGDTRQPGDATFTNSDRRYGLVRHGIGGSYGGDPVAASRAFQAWCEAWAREALRVLKPGGHLVAFGGTRTYHRLACGLEDAGFEIRDCLSWLYGSGFPKSLNVSKAIESHLTRGSSNSRNLRQTEQAGDGAPYTFAGRNNGIMGEPRVYDRKTFTPSTAEAREWEGWGTALKPAWEPAVLARKPLVGTVARNVLEHGTGALNIDGCRIGTDLMRRTKSNGEVVSGNRAMAGGNTGRIDVGAAEGRWPANVALDDVAAAMLDDQAGELRARGNTAPTKRRVASPGWGTIGAGPDGPVDPGDSGGPSRFFYTAKASRRERGEGNTHPTVKPLALMRWIVRLVTPPGGLVLDPFAGSGTTGVACREEGVSCILIEREQEYVDIIDDRLRQGSLLGGAA